MAIPEQISSVSHPAECTCKSCKSLSRELTKRHLKEPKKAANQWNS